MTRYILLPLLLLSLLLSVEASVICYECHANSTEQGRFCSIDKLCQGTSCFFELKSDNTWSSGCSSALSTNANITCSSSSSSSSCSCNTDFCNSFAKSEAALKRGTGRNSWWGPRNDRETNVTLALPDRNLIHCEECGSVTVGNQTLQIPCDHDHTCQGNYCVSVRGQTPFSYCGGVWDKEKSPACYFDFDAPETCICSLHMCNALLDPEPIYTTTPSLSDPTLASLIPIIQSPTAQPPVQVVTIPTTTGSTVKPTTKRKCKNSKLSPNDQAVFMGEKLKNVILSGFGSDDGAVQNFEDDINDHICNYSEDE